MELTRLGLSQSWMVVLTSVILLCTEVSSFVMYTLFTWRNMNISSCGYLLLFIKMSLKCEHGWGQYYTWSKWDGCIQLQVLSCYVQKYVLIPTVMYCELCCLHLKCSVYKHLNT